MKEKIESNKLIPKDFELHSQEWLYYLDFSASPRQIRPFWRHKTLNIAFRRSCPDNWEDFFQMPFWEIQIKHNKTVHKVKIYGIVTLDRLESLYFGLTGEKIDFHDYQIWNFG